MAINSLYSQPKPNNFLSSAVYHAPVEGLAFIVAGCTASLFSSSISSPLFGIGIGLITTKLVLKILDRYASKVFISLTKEICKINKMYPKLQAIALVFSLVIGVFSPTFGIFTGIGVGAFNAVVLDVENFELLQSLDRKTKFN